MICRLDVSTVQNYEKSQYNFEGELKKWMILLYSKKYIVSNE